MSKRNRLKSAANRFSLTSVIPFRNRPFRPPSSNRLINSRGSIDSRAREFLPVFENCVFFSRRHSHLIAPIRPQGIRVLKPRKTSDKFLEGGLIPTTKLAFAAQTRFEGSVSLQYIER